MVVGKLTGHFPENSSKVSPLPSSTKFPSHNSLYKNNTTQLLLSYKLKKTSPFPFLSGSLWKPRNSKPTRNKARDMEEEQQQQPLSQILKVLEALKEASQELQAHPPDPDSNPSSFPAVKALLELQTESDTFLSRDPNLSNLSLHLSTLKSLLQDRASHGGLIRNFLTRRVSTHSISRVAGSIQSEIQAWIDRESIDNLSAALREGDSSSHEEELLILLDRFETRVSSGFDRELQDLVLKSRILGSLERALCDPARHPARIRETCASAICALVRFNKDVFVGEVKMGPLVHSLVSMATCKSVEVLSALIRCIKSPLVDELEANREIPKIISYLENKDAQMKVVAFDCVLDIGYFGRKEAVEAMLKEGLVGKLVELQRSELGGDLIELGKFSAKEEEGKRESRGKRERRFLEGHPFASCVARFWVQLEVGEGLRQREKRAFKVEILERVREACVSDAEAATIVAEVLWGSSP